MASHVTEAQGFGVGLVRSARRSRKRHRGHALRDRAEVALYIGGTALLRALSPRTGYSIARKIATHTFDSDGKRARCALANARIAFPHLPVDEQRRIVRESFVHFAYNLVDMSRSMSWTAAELMERCPIEGTFYLDRALERGRGALLLTLHLGNWELAVQALGIGIARHRPCVVGRPMRNQLLYRRLASARQISGVELLDRRNALMAVARRLRKNRPVAFLNDQYIRSSRGVLAPFLGVRASSPAGLAILALRTGAPIVPCYNVRIGPGRYQGRFLPELELKLTGHRKHDLVEVTTQCNRVLESVIRATPEQWLWTHRRFRNSPDLAYDPYSSAARA